MPVKNFNSVLLTFLPAFLFTLSVHGATPHIDTVRTKQKAAEALAFCKKHGYNTHYCILIDMSLPSGVKRFLVWDFDKNNIFISGLVSHGCGTNPWSGVWSKKSPQFSNRDNSHCTSLGKYRVGGRGYSQWGLHVKYILTGLEKNNSNAFARNVVLHSWDKIAESEVYPDGTPEGWGCPAVSNHTMKIVDELLRRQKKHLLLWIYN